MTNLDILLELMTSGLQKVYKSFFFFFLIWVLRSIKIISLISLIQVGGAKDPREKPHDHLQANSACLTCDPS